MAPAIETAILLLAFTLTAFAQVPSKQTAGSGRLGMTCEQILQMKSSDWIAKATATDAPPVRSQLPAIRVYGNCYDARTDRLVASLARASKSPSMRARADFRDFESALKNFTVKALAVDGAQPDPLKSAYAALYEKQFRYTFYQGYASGKAGSRTGQTAKSSSIARAGDASQGTIPKTTAGQRSGDSSSESSPNAVDQITAAKNRFGELLGALPDAKIHELHAAFGEVVGPRPISGAAQLAVYRYAIFLLEPANPAIQSAPSKANPEAFSPPF
jgi:hypothetical protein